MKKGDFKKNTLIDQVKSKIFETKMTLTYKMAD